MPPRNEQKEILLQLDRYALYYIQSINKDLLISSHIPLINSNLEFIINSQTIIKKTGLYVIDGSISTKSIVTILVVYLNNIIKTFESDIIQFVHNLPNNNLLKQLYMKENDKWDSISNSEGNKVLINNMSEILCNNFPEYFKRNNTERINKAASIICKVLFEISYDIALSFSYTATSYKPSMLIRYILQCEALLGSDIDDILKRRFMEYKSTLAKKITKKTTPKAAPKSTPKVESKVESQPPSQLPPQEYSEDSHESTHDEASDLVSD